MSSEAAPMEKPAVLIIGGLGPTTPSFCSRPTGDTDSDILGYTGRNLTKYLHDNNLASEIRIVDKHLPELAWLAPEFKEACSKERFVQADAAQESAYNTFLQTQLVVSGIYTAQG